MPSADSTAPSTPSVPAAVDEKKVVRAVAALRPGREGGFTAESLAAVDDLDSVLPPGATVLPVDGSVDVVGDLASVDAVVRAEGHPDRTYWVFLERRDGEWLVYLTLPLDP